MFQNLQDEDRCHRLFDYSRKSKTRTQYNWIDTKYKILNILKKSIFKIFRIFLIWLIVQGISPNSDHEKFLLGGL
jgi:hypothetical protein